MFLRNLLGEKRSAKVDPRHPRDPALARLFGMFGGSKSGVAVSTDSALRVATSMACIRVIAETIAMLPLHTYKRGKNGEKMPAVDHQVYDLLHRRPNKFQTAQRFRSLMQMLALTHGNAYAEIIFDGAGKPVQLIPRHPDKVVPFFAKDDEVAYAYYPGKGSRRIILQDEMLHIMGMSENGLYGMSPVEKCAESFGIALAAEAYGARFFANDSRPGGYLKHPGSLSEGAIDRLIKDWEKRHMGGDNAHRYAVLEEGLDFQEVGIPPEQAQFLETRKFQRQEIAALYRVPPHKVGIMDNATFSNIEHQGQEFVTDTMLPWSVNWEQEIEIKLFSERERQQYFVRHKMAGLLRGDIKTRYESYAIGRNWGFLNVDDIRELEDMNPLPNGIGQIYLQPLNMVEAGTDPKAAQEAKRSALLSVLDKAADRVLAKEVKAVRNAVQKSADPAWYEEFYRDHRDFMIKAISLDSGSARQWCQDQLQRLKNVLEDPEKLEKELASWEIDGVRRLINVFMEEKENG